MIGKGKLPAARLGCMPVARTARSYSILDFWPVSAFSATKGYLLSPGACNASATLPPADKFYIWRGLDLFQNLDIAPGRAQVYVIHGDHGLRGLFRNIQALLESCHTANIRTIAEVIFIARAGTLHKSHLESGALPSEGRRILPPVGPNAEARRSICILEIQRFYAAAAKVDQIGHVV